MKRVRSVALVASMLVGVLLAAPGNAGAQAKPRIDKAAILEIGADITTQGGGASFDPALIGTAITSDAGYFYMPYLYDQFIQIDNNGNLQPRLATKWATPDPNTVLLTIRQGVKFQDGTPFTTTAIKQAWDRIRTTPLSTASHSDLWDKITAIDLVGTDQIKVTLSTPSSGAFLTRILALGTSSVPSPAAVAKWGADYKYHPVGAGPYAFDSFQQGQKLSLRKWNGYWDAKNTQKLGGVDIVQTSAGAPTVASLLAGQIELAKTSVAFMSGLQGQPNLTTSTFPKNSTALLLLPCTNKAPFNNADARAAVSTAIDRKAVNQAAYNNLGTPGETLFPKGSAYYFADFANEHAYSVKKAKELAVKGGIQPGTPIKLMVTVSSEGADRAAVVVQDQLKQIGLNAELALSTSFTTDAKRLQPDLIMVSTDANNIQSFLLTGGVVNWCQYSNPTLDKFINTIATNGETGNANKPTWRSIQEIVSDNSIYIPLVGSPIVYAHSKQVQGLSITPFGKLIVTDLYVTSKR